MKRFLFKNICDPSEKFAEDKRIFRELKTNHYTASLLKNSFNFINNPICSNNVSDQEIKYISAPYIKGASERISRLLEPFHIKLALKPSNTIRSKLSRLKDILEDKDKNLIVYKIPCYSCNNCYVGETGWQLHVRLSEHKRDFERKNMRSQVVQHALENGHRMDWDNATVLGFMKDEKGRKILESFYSFKENSFNRREEISDCLIYVALNHL